MRNKEKGRFLISVSENKIILCATLCLCASVVLSQDYIITHQNDTLACRLVTHPRKEGIKPAESHKNGYRKIVAVLASDSLRTFAPAEINGYYRQKHGKDLLCNGFFETKEISNPSARVGALNRGQLTQFMRRISYGPHATLYAHFAESGSKRYLYYYLSRPGESFSQATEVRNRKHLVELLSDTDITKEMNGFSKKEKRKLANIVLAYNKAKG